MIKSIRYTNLEYGMSMYLNNDPDQEPLTLVGVLTLQDKGTKFLLVDVYGNENLYWDCQCSVTKREKGEEPTKPDDEEEDD
jgi:hypothetical protein